MTSPNQGSPKVKPMEEMTNSKAPGIELTEEQNQVCDAVRDWFVDPDTTIKIGGYAGTGKTTITIELLKLLAKDYKDRKNRYFYPQLMAFTGKASQVLAKKAQRSAFTIHRTIYKPIIDPDTKRITGWRKVPFLDADLLLIDEASMVPEDIYKDLLSYNIPIIAVGDHGQLPPVKGTFNLMESPDLTLNQIHRNANGIAKVSERIRHGEHLGFGELNENVCRVDTRTWGSWSNAPSEVIESVFDPSPDKMFITALNKDRVNSNITIRRKYLGDKIVDDTPVEGDRVICIRNNWELGIYNGMPGTVKSVHKINTGVYEIEFLPDGETVTDTFRITDHFFHKQYHSEPKDKYIPKDLGRFDYGYCITCHKSQGSEAKTVTVLGEGFGDHILRRRWLYTAVTRAKERALMLFN